jgi:hypothetical protein
METQEINHIESNTRIYFTNDYGRFKFLKGNRDLIESKVNKIKDVIHAGVDVLKYAPIIVNEAMEIIDGQHRFAVSRELKANVYYVIHKDADLSIVPTINSNHTKWRNADFMNSYLDLKRPAYIELQTFIMAHEGISLSTAVKVFHSGTPASSEALEAFRDGTLSIDGKDRAYHLGNLLSGFAGHTDNPYSSLFFHVMIQLDGNDKYSHELMLRKLEEQAEKLAK